MYTGSLSLLQLRGLFRDPLLPADYPLFPTRNIIDVFLIDREHIIIVLEQSVHLLCLPRQAFLWSIFTAVPITGAAFAPDQPLLALGSLEGTILWDLSTGQIAQRLACPWSEPGSNQLVFGPGGWLASTSLNEGLQLWNIEAGQAHCTFIDGEGKYLQSQSFISMEFSPDGEFLAVADADTFANVWLWRVADGHLHQTLYGHPYSQSILGLAFTPDSKMLVGSEWSTDPEEESMPIWELPSGKRIGKLPRMAWLPTVSFDGQYVASVNEEALLLWSLAEREIIWQSEADATTRKLTFDPAGHFLVLSGSNNTVQWYNVQSGQKVYTLRGADLPGIKLVSDSSTFQ